MKSRIPISVPDLSGREDEYLQECIRSGWVSSIGPFVKRFEAEFAAFCDRPFGVSVNSGTAAIHLALRVLRVGPGDEVIVPALTFASVANCIIYQGATPVFVDCQPDSWNLDPEQLESLISNRTAAIMPVHLYGLPCEMDQVLEVARASDTPVVEDCAEAHGAVFDSRPVGSFGVIGCFSFYGNKIITTGEGGMCVTSDESLDERLRVLRDHGMNKRRRYWHDEVGYNYRMTNLQAAVGCAQLERIEKFLSKKRWVAQKYQQRLNSTDLILPTDIRKAASVYWLYTVILPERFTEADRDDLIKYLGEQGVDSRPFFYPLHKMPPYEQYARPLPNSESIAARGITLPSFHAMSEQEIDRVSTTLTQWLGRQ